MKFKSEHITAASGSIGGVTYARAKGGIMYRRARAMPVNPNSTRQQIIKAVVASLAQIWNDVLTQAERTGWEQYAASVTVTDKLGDQINLSGQQMYIRCNAPRMAFDTLADQLEWSEPPELGRIDDGPVAADIGETGTMISAVLDVNSAVDTLVMKFDGSPQWATEIGSNLLVQIGIPVSNGVQYFNGPFRTAGYAGVLASGEATITNGETGGFPFTLTEGARIFLRYRASYADGRLSNAQRFGPFNVIDSTV